MPAKVLATLAAIMIVLGVAAGPAGAQTFHVGPQGNDGNAGDGPHPFATLQRACAASRQGPAGTDRRIVVHGGAYDGVNVVLTGRDSGLTIEAAAGEKPELFGGVRLNDWRKDGEHFYAATIPPGANGLDPQMLEVDGQMSPRARLPDEGTFTHLTKFTVRWMSSTGGGWERKPTVQELTTLQYKPEDLGAWLDAKNAQVTIYHMWDDSVVGVAAIDPARQMLTLSSPCGHPPGAFGVQKYVVWNVREGMHRPGQWYHDRGSGRIVYWPQPGQDMATVKAVIPTVETVIRLKGTHNEPVRNITLRGLAIHSTTVPLHAAGFAAADFDGAVSLEHAQDCLLDGLEVSRVCGQAINARGDVARIRVQSCRIGPCGAGGIYVGGHDSTIHNNHVQGIGLFYPAAIGIFRGGEHNTVSHNLVHDCSYTAINYGGTGNIIENNLIYDCMKTLHDGAAIYLFAAKDCIIRGNLARDIVDTGGYGASAYYLDERSEGCVIENNVALRVHYLGNNHMATRNTIRNNVYVVPDGDAKLNFARSSNFTLEKNIIWAKGKIELNGIDAVTTWSHNILYSGSGTIVGIHLNQYAAAGKTSGAPGDTVAADPLFVDPDHGDWHFKPDSPAVKLGIAPVDVSGAGLTK
jgi:hypothetical protein